MKTKDVVCVVICMDQRPFTAKRNSGVYENTWKFSGGKIESRETQEQAVTHKIRGELELCVDTSRYLTAIRNNREDCTLLVYVYLCRYVGGETHLYAHHEYVLVTLRELYSYQFEVIDRLILDVFQENTL